MNKKISRRSFIKQSAASITLAGLSSILMTQQAPAYIKGKNYNFRKLFPNNFLNSIIK